MSTAKTLIIISKMIAYLFISRYSKTCVTPHACGKSDRSSFHTRNILPLSITPLSVIIFSAPHDTSNSSKKHKHLKKHGCEKGVHWLSRLPAIQCPFEVT
jgi:hypothetical protein